MRRSATHGMRSGLSGSRSRPEQPDVRGVSASRLPHRPLARPLLLALAWSASATTAWPTRASAQSLPAGLIEFLRQKIGLTQGEMHAAMTGTPVVRAVNQPDHREIALVGVVRVSVPRAFYIRRVVDFRSSLRNPTRLAFALFSDPAVAGDVAAFSLPHGDVQDLARCDSGACKVKLATRAIAQLRASIDPTSPRADSIATAYFRNYMLRYVTAYRQRGNGALIVYEDQRLATAAAQVWDAMLSRSPYMYEYAPSLERYLKSYPHDRPANIREVLFWSEDDLPDLKPTLSITHENGLHAARAPRDYAHRVEAALCRPLPQWSA